MAKVTFYLEGHGPWPEDASEAEVIQQATMWINACKTIFMTTVPVPGDKIYVCGNEFEVEARSFWIEAGAHDWQISLCPLVITVTHATQIYDDLVKDRWDVDPDRDLYIENIQIERNKP